MRMSKEEASARMNEAIERWGKVQPIGMLLAVAMLWFFSGLRWIVMFCAGFGIAKACPVSLWFGPVFGAVLVVTVGRMWTWWRRDARIESIEKAAAAAEKLEGGAE